MYGKILVGLVLLIGISSAVTDETIFGEVRAAASEIGVDPAVVRINEYSFGPELDIIVYNDAITESGQGQQVANDLLRIGQTVSMSYPERKIYQVWVAVTCTANNLDQNIADECQIYYRHGSGSSFG